MFCSQCGNVLFPVWECFVPSVGISSQPPATLPGTNN